MKHFLLFLALTLPALAQDTPELKPGAVMKFEFPDLPPTLEAMDSGRPSVATLTARLPENYTGDGKFPLFIYLLGGPGGRGEERHLKLGQYTIGSRDFITVTMPLFKRALDKREPANGLMVSMDDAATIGRCYRAMLEKLFVAVPNIAPERSTLGGHSNGAHTTGVLLAAQDEFILARFRQFFLQEGGTGPLFANVLQKQSFRGPRFLVMMGGKRPPGADPQKPSPWSAMSEALRAMTERSKLDFTFVSMEGYGHEQPPEYLRVIGQWARGEPLDDVPAVQKFLSEKLTLPLRAHPDTSPWPDLIAPDLSNWKCAKGGVWSFENGVLTATEDENLWTKNWFSDCVIDLEYRCEPGANSGVFLGNFTEKEWMPASIEIQICDDDAPKWKEKPATWYTGAFFGHQAPLKRASKPAGEWNRLTIHDQGARLTVVLNGEVVNEIDLSRFTNGAQNPDGSDVPSWLRGQPWSQRPKLGRVGLQGRHAGAGIEFRNVKLLRLSRP